MINEQKLAKIKEFIDLTKTSLTYEEFTDAFKKVLDFVKEIKRTNSLELGFLDTKYTEKVKEIKDNYGGDMEGLKSDAMKYMIDELAKVSETIDNKMAEVKNGVDGLNADVEEVARMASEMVVVPKIEEIENDLPKLGGSIASALELLPDGEKLKVDAIEGLKELLEEKRLGGKGGGGFSKMAWTQYIVDLYAPTGDINSVNKDFELSSLPSPATSLEVYLQGQLQDLTTCYTLSGTTLSFVDAPITGNTLKCKHRR